MNKDKFLRFAGITAIILFLVWLVVLLFMGESAKLPTAIGGFCAGWYLRSFIKGIQDVLNGKVERYLVNGDEEKPSVQPK